MMTDLGYSTNLVASRIVNRNMNFLQNLTAQTTTSTTPVQIGSISLQPKFSGRVHVRLVVRGSNNTVADGITVGLYNGSTLIDSETYTESTAGVETTFVMEYDSGIFVNGVLQPEGSLTIGTTYTFSAQISAVTGGTASAKIIALEAEEY